MSTLLKQVAQPQGQSTPKHPSTGTKICNCGRIKHLQAKICHECVAQRPPRTDRVVVIDGIRCREIPLTQQQYALCSEGDYEQLITLDWQAQWSKPMKQFYAYTCVKIDGKWFHIPMTRMILGVTDPKLEVDHRNGNTLHNYRENLRIATSAQNQSNCRIRKDNTSGFRGVTWHTRVGKWHAKLSYKGKRISCGYFATKEEAAQARDKAALLYHGEFARLNFSHPASP